MDAWTVYALVGLAASALGLLASFYAIHLQNKENADNNQPPAGYKNNTGK